MKVRITRTVPGYVNGVHLTADSEHNLEQATAVSLLGDGYAELIEDATGRAPADSRETATKRGPGRPRRDG